MEAYDCGKEGKTFGWKVDSDLHICLAWYTEGHIDVALVFTPSHTEHQLLGSILASLAHATFRSGYDQQTLRIYTTLNYIELH